MLAQGNLKMQITFSLHIFAKLCGLQIKAKP